MRKIGLTSWIFIGIILGVICGWAIGEPLLVISKPLGTLFLRLLRMVIVPLVFSSIVTGVAGIGNTGNLGRLGGKTLLYYLTTSLLAILTGLVVVNLVRPGVGAELGLEETPASLATGEAGLGDLLMRMIPENPERPCRDHGEPQKPPDSLGKRRKSMAISGIATSTRRADSRRCLPMTPSGSLTWMSTPVATHTETNR